MVCYAEQHNQIRPTGGTSGAIPFCVTTPVGPFFGVSTMKKIDISTPKHPNKFALVDDEDYESLISFHWYFEAVGQGYAGATIWIDGKKRHVKMHRMIMDAKKGQEIDHENHDGLDNQKHNLRFCTRSQNCANSMKRTGTIAKYKGVYLFKGKYQSSIGFKGNHIWLGLYSCPIEAAKAYDKAAKKYFGEFARPNFNE